MAKVLATSGSKAPQERHPGGRPALFENPMDLEAKWEEYLNKVAQEKETDSEKIPRITEGIYEMGFNSRQAFYKQADRNPEFFDIVKRIELYCKNVLEDKLLREKSNPTKWIYALNSTGYPKEYLGGSRTTRIGGNVIIIKTNEKPDLTIDNQEIDYDES